MRSAQKDEPEGRHLVKSSNRLRAILNSDTWSMQVLEAVRTLQLPDWAIGAGFVRALVWDHLAGCKRTELHDVDVLYFDPHEHPRDENEHERALLAKLPSVPWSVKNQARMHIRNQTDPYSSTEDAMRFWLETPTAVAVRLEYDDSLTVLAPYGLSDLFEMVIRPTPAARAKMDQFEARLAEKPWLSTWSNVRVQRS